jgi:hypothetical protein
MPTSASSESAVPGRSQLLPCFPRPRAMSRKNLRCKTIGLEGLQALALRTKFLTQGAGAPPDRPLGRRAPLVLMMLAVAGRPPAVTASGRHLPSPSGRQMAWARQMGPSDGAFGGVLSCRRDGRMRGLSEDSDTGT